MLRWQCAARGRTPPATNLGLQPEATRARNDRRGATRMQTRSDVPLVRRVAVVSAVPVAITAALRVPVIQDGEIGRASCRERVYILVVGGGTKKRKRDNPEMPNVCVAA